MQIFDTKEAPDGIGGVCCGQFAVSRAKVLERPRRDYERMLRWAVETELTDGYGVGWVFEKVWHVVFGMPPVQSVLPSNALLAFMTRGAIAGLVC